MWHSSLCALQRTSDTSAASRLCTGLPTLTHPTPALAQAFELRLWPDQHPLRQFEQQLSFELLRKLEDRNLTLDVLAVSGGSDFVTIWVV